MTSMVVKFPGSYRPVIPRYKLHQCAECLHGVVLCPDILKFLTSEIGSNDTGECQNYHKVTESELIQIMLGKIEKPALKPVQKKSLSK